MTQFKPSLLTDPNTVVHCPTQEQFNTYLEWIKTQGGVTPLITRDWQTYKQSSCVRNGGSYAGFFWYKSRDYTIIPYEEALLKTRSDFRIGDRVYCLGRGRTTGWFKVISEGYDRLNNVDAYHIESEVTPSFVIVITADGKWFDDDTHRSIFFSKPEVTGLTSLPETPEPDTITLHDLIVKAGLDPANTIVKETTK